MVRKRQILFILLTVAMLAQLMIMPAWAAEDTILAETEMPTEAETTEATLPEETQPTDPERTETTETEPTEPTEATEKPTEEATAETEPEAAASQGIGPRWEVPHFSRMTIPMTAAAAGRLRPMAVGSPALPWLRLT